MQSRSGLAYTWISLDSFAQRVPNLDLKIYDKEAGVGGTWFVNKYPVSRTRVSCIRCVSE